MKLPAALSPSQLVGLAAAFDWSVANPSPAAQHLFPQPGTIFYQDLRPLAGNPVLTGLMNRYMPMEGANDIL